MQLEQLFKVSAIAAALTLAGCGGDIVINEGDEVVAAPTPTPPTPTPPTPTPPTPTPADPNGPNIPDTVVNAFDQSLATDVSANFPEITDKPVYQLSADTVFTTNVSLTNDAHWLIKGRTAVGNDQADSAVLYIQEGTTVFGEEGNDFLVVSRGSQIEAVGSRQEPITFTSVQDVTGAETSIGQWGGLVLLGNAPTNLCNSGDDTDTSQEELDNCGTPSEGGAGNFGGNNPEDNSGSLEYVVVKHAGNALSAGDELNGISFAGIGSGTTVNFIQVHENLDDGIEFFGGTVSVSNVVLTSIGDDSLDWSFGWTGSATNVYIQQSAEFGDNAIEADNHDENTDWTVMGQVTNPTISNLTIVMEEGTNGVRLRNGTAGSLSNVVVTGPATAQNCLRVNGDDSIALAAAGELTITDSVIACANPANNFGDDQIGGASTEAWFLGQQGNSSVAPGELLLESNGYFPTSGSPLNLGNGEYIGAFDPNGSDWTTGWTVGVNGGFPTDVQNALEQGLATNVSGNFPAITDKPVYQLNTDTVFTSDVTLTNDAHWLIKGRTAVGNDQADSATLFIQAGTTVFGEEGNDFLVVSRGSKIEAAGSQTAPITFTSVQDLSGDETNIGQWGGLVLLGNAPTNLCNSGDDTDTSADELANCGTPSEGGAGNFGGNDPTDDSGTLSYVVVKHAGNALSAGDELNGISFAGIGSRTRLEFIQVHQNLDDGVEFFGGTANIRNLVLTDIGDDSLDWSFGWTGNAQNIYIQQSSAVGDNAIEADNHDENTDWTVLGELTNPTISNLTVVGANGANGVRLRNGTAGSLRNVVVTYQDGQEDYANCLRVNGDDSIALAQSGELNIQNSVVACASDSAFDGGPIGSEDTAAWFAGQAGNSAMTRNELLLSTDGFTPRAGSPLLGNGTDASELDPFFTSTDYIGAFDGTNNWMEGWTVAVSSPFPTDVQNALEQGLATDVSANFPAITDKPVYQLGTDTVFTSDVTFTNDAHWLIKGRTAVGNDQADSATLFIQQGTTVFGEEGNDFLVVSRNSKVEAVGTATLPITFTSVQDLSGDETNIGQWGGLVLLGNAPTNLCNSGDDTDASAEELANCGTPAEGAAGNFGGDDPEDNSGTLRYVVVKHAGNALSAGDELNGISLGGIGRGTNLSFIQVHENLDDGVEFFGGTANIDHLVLTSIGDDSLDWSFGWTGNAQFVVIKQSSEVGDNAIEADNHDENTDWTVLGQVTKPTVSNLTILGAANANGVRLRNGTAGTLVNTVIAGPADYSNCLRVNGDDSIALAQAGELSISYSAVACTSDSAFGGGPIGGADTQAWFEAQTGNSVSTLADFSFQDNGYQPGDGSSLLGSGVDASTLNSFFNSTDYIGAFDGTVDWTAGWVTVGLND